jgi:hypothetical protein
MDAYYVPKSLPYLSFSVGSWKVKKNLTNYSYETILLLNLIWNTSMYPVSPEQTYLYVGFYGASGYGLIYPTAYPKREFGYLFWKS